MNYDHTPGPWRVDPHYPTDIQSADGLLEIGRAPCKEDAGQKAVFPVNAPPFEQAIANARLIAAAPILLDNAITDVNLIEGWINDLRSGKDPDVIAYGLENLLVSHRKAICVATGKNELAYC